MDDSTMTREQLLGELEVLRRRMPELESAAEDRERTEAALRKSEERFRKIFDHSNDAIFLVDPEEDEILDVNAKACRMLGYPREELLAVPMSMIHPHEMPHFRPLHGPSTSAGTGGPTSSRARPSRRPPWRPRCPPRS